MNEKPPLLYDVVYPPDLIKSIRSSGRCDVIEIAKKGMVLAFDSVLPKEQSTIENLSQIPRLFIDEFSFFNAINIDDFVKSVSEAAEFIMETGVAGDFPLWLFKNIVLITEVYSKKRVDELEEKEKETGKPQPNGCCAKFIQIQSEATKEQGKEHWLILVSTHNYLISGFYLDSLIERHRRNLADLKVRTEKGKRKNNRKTFTKSIRHEVFKRDDYRCIECGATEKESCLHIDHIIPVSRGGTDELDNLQTLCESCNLAKKDRILNNKMK